MHATPSNPLEEKALETLQKVFGFPHLRPGQDEAVRALLEGKDVFAVMPTGAGKSLCFQLPALLRDGLTIVVSPLIALMQDQVAGLQLLGIEAETVNSSLSVEQKRDIWLKVKSGTLKFLYISPEMLMTDRMIGALKAIQPRFFAIDEVHCMSQWGAAFRPEYAELKHLKTLFPNTPLIGLTATADPKTREDIKHSLFAQPPVEVRTGFDRPNLKLMVEQREASKQQLETFLEDRKGQNGIVYCLSRKGTEETAAKLEALGHTALAYHAGMSSAQRSKVQERFLSENGLIIVATIAFGMGIDKPDIRFVAHTNLPSNMEAYYQEIGRAGRDGDAADCLMLWGGNDISQRRRFIGEENSSEEHKALNVQRLNALMAYIDSPKCRRAAMLRYFGDSDAAERFEAFNQQQGCGNCDLCLNPAPIQDARQEAKHVAKAIQETGERFGIAHICDVLRGADTQRMQQFGHTKLGSFGLGKQHSLDFWRGITRQMQSAGLIEIDLSNYHRACITPKLRRVVAGQEDFSIRLQTKTNASKRTKTSKPQQAGHQDLDASQSVLLQRLKSLRRSLAEEAKVPAYVIFSDRSLIDMAQKQPDTKAAFENIHGVGAAKLEKFADIFVAAIRDQDA